MKNLGTIAYFFFIVVVTYVNVLFGQASQVVYFLEENKTVLYDHAPSLLQAVVIANARGEKDAFVSTLIESKDLESSTTSATVSFYALTMFSNNVFEDFLAIYLHDLTIVDDQLKKDNQDDSFVYLTLTFNEEVTLDQTPKSIFEETMITLYDRTQKLVLLPIGVLLDRYPSLQIERLSFQYDLLSGYQQSFGELNEEDLINIHAFDMRLSDDYQDSYTISSEVNYLPHLLETFGDTVSLLYGHLVWELVFVLPLTYFLFFHRLVRERRKKIRFLNSDTPQNK
jgi:hypothetical protein